MKLNNLDRQVEDPAGSSVRSKIRHKEVIDFVFDKTKNNQR